MNKKPVLEIGAAYIRVSTNDQTELSPDAQLREIKKAAEADGILIPGEFIFIEEKGVSGRRADNRKQFQRMISMAKAQPSPFRYLYLWKFSRFARNQEESMFYKGILRKKCGVTIKSVSEPIMEGMFGRLIESIIEWFDEYYSINLSGEVTRGMTEKALRKGYQASPCLGYQAAGEGKPFLINEAEYRIVEYIHKSFHGGMDLSAIARSANGQGFLTKRGNPFDRRGVERILRNRFYAGIVTWKDISFQGSHETRESVTSVFEDNQRRLEREYRPRSRREVSGCRHWASGLLKCGCCGASLSFNKTGDAGRSGYFQCWRYAKGFHEESCSISVQKAEDLILESLKKALEPGALTYEYVPKPLSSHTGEEERIKAALSRLLLKEQRIRSAYENGIDSQEEYRAGKERIKIEQSRLKDRLEELQSLKDRDEAMDQLYLAVRIRSACDIISHPDVDTQAKGRALRGVVKKIVYDRQENKLKFFYYISG
ncbi:recombinase family protein [Lachnospiraceae bacterium 54-53]